MNYTPWGFDESPAPQQRDLRQDRKQVSVVALAVIFISLATVLAQLVAILLIRAIAPEWEQTNWYLIAVSTLPMYLVAMPLSLLLFRFAKPSKPAGARMSLGVWLGALVICFALTYIGNYIGTFVNLILEMITGKPPVNNIEELTASTPFWANLLFVGILAPVLEEIFYRKLVIDRLLTFGELPAILLSGILFGLIHGNFGQFFYAAILGVVFGFIYVRTGKLRYTIGLHMAINLWGGVYASEMLRRLDLDALGADPLAYIADNPTPVLMLLAYFGFMLLSFVLAPIAAVLLRRRIRLQKAEAPLSPSGWCRVLLLNPAVWVCALLLGLTFFL